MERILLGIPALAMCLTGNAQLAPTTDAPLYRHLLEVNKEWSVMDPEPADGDRLVHFSSESERIAAHLRLVAAYQRAHVPEELSASARAERASLLDKLDDYAARGRFPQNHVLPVRNPVFIDPHGTACAVGQLMIESGHAELAERIRQEMNLAYVHDMRRADVFAWAGEHGFSEDELAWIQPGYPPNIPWYGLGGGTNGRVAELLRLQNGDLIVAGEFSVAGGTVTSQVARWNGSTYSALGSGVIGQVTSAIEFEGDIYLGGSFGQGSADLARWTGSAWVLSSAFSSKLPYVSDLHVHNGVLYAAGATTGFAGTSYEVKRLVGGAWEMVGQQLNGEIRAMESFDGTLVCGGAFTDNFFSQDTTILHVARLNGAAWEQLGNGLDGTVRDLLLADGGLFAAGDCVGEVATYFGLARLEAGQSSWTLLMPNVSDYFYSPLDGIVGINAMVPDPDGTRIHLGGDFYAGVGLVYGTGLATFNGSADDVAVLGEFVGPVNDLELFGTSELVAGGSSEQLMNIASTDLALTVPTGEETPRLVLWPNPAVDRIRIDGAGTKPLDRLEVLDATGRVVRRSANVTPANALDVGDLPIGSYTIRITADNKVTSATFVKR